MKYPLLPYSQLVFDMLKTNPEVYTTRFSLCIDKRDVDFERLNQAVHLALLNHPVFATTIDEDGLQYPASLSDILHGPYHAFDFHNEGNTLRIDVAYNRILGDTKSELIFYEDIIRSYQGLPLQPDHYWDYLERVEQYKQSPDYQANRLWLESMYGRISCPVRPNTDVPLDAIEIPIEGTLLNEYTDLREALNRLMAEKLLPLTAFFSLTSALAIMEYNGTNEAALTWAYDGRETEDDQRIYGSLHRDIPFLINRNSKIETQKSELIRQTRNQFREGIAHSSYPLTLTKPHTDLWNYALNVLVRPTIGEMTESFPFPFKVLASNDEEKPAYALLDVEILDTEQLYICYRYSASHYKKESIRRFAALVRKYAEWLLEE